MKAKLFLELVDRERGVSLESAVVIVAARNRRLVASVLDEIGAWPSSDPALRFLQQIESRGAS